MGPSSLGTRLPFGQTKIDYKQTIFYVTPPLHCKMSSTMSLNSRVNIFDKSGGKEIISVRELLNRGSGAAFECFQMLDEYDKLAEAYDLEMASLSEQRDRDDHLPLGAHLLPQDYQDFLYSWNKTIATSPGCRWWKGVGRDTYKATNKEAWAKWVAQNKEFRARYAAEVEQLIAYQASYTIDKDRYVVEASSESESESEIISLKIEQS